MDEDVRNILTTIVDDVIKQGLAFTRDTKNRNNPRDAAAAQYDMKGADVLQMTIGTRRKVPLKHHATKSERFIQDTFRILRKVRAVAA